MSSERRDSRSRVAAALLVTAAGAALLVGLGAFPLTEPDEGRYADIAAGMARGGDWLTPRLNDIRYYEKPPLFFWLAAISMKVFGIHEAAARLPSVLAALACVGIVTAWGRRTRSPRVGILACLVLVSMPMFAVLARIAIVDVLLAAFVTLALYASYRGVIEPNLARSRGAAVRVVRGWIWAAWASAALAALVKGPVGVVLSFSGVGVYLVGTRQWRGLWEWLRPDGPLLFLAIAAPWYIAMSLENRGFAYHFFASQNLVRFTTGGWFHRKGPFWYYLPILIATTLPWAVALPVVVRDAWRARSGSDALSRHRLFLASASVVPLVILSIASSKRAYYLLPLLPVLAVAIADSLDSMFGAHRASGFAWTRVALVSIAIASLGIATTALLLAIADPSSLTDRASTWTVDVDMARVSIVQAALPSLILATGALAIGALIAAWLWNRAPLLAPGAYAAGFLIMLAAIPWMMAPLGELYSVVPIVRAIDAHARPSEKVLFYGRFHRGVPFYRGEPALLWKAAYSEFGHEIHRREARGRALQSDPAKLQQLLLDEPSVLIVARDDERLVELREMAPVEIEVLEQGLRFTLLRSHGEKPHSKDPT